MIDIGHIAHAAATLSELGIATIIVTLVDIEARRGKRFESNSIRSMFNYFKLYAAVKWLRRNEHGWRGQGGGGKGLGDSIDMMEGALNNGDPIKFWVRTRDYMVQLNSAKWFRLGMRRAFIYFVIRVHLLPWSALIFGGLGLFLLAAPDLPMAWAQSFAKLVASIVTMLWTAATVPFTFAWNPRPDFDTEVVAFFCGAASLGISLFALHMMSVSHNAYESLKLDLGLKRPMFVTGELLRILRGGNKTP